MGLIAFELFSARMVRVGLGRPRRAARRYVTECGDVPAAPEFRILAVLGTAARCGPGPGGGSGLQQLRLAKAYRGLDHGLRAAGSGEYSKMT